MEVNLRKLVDGRHIKIKMRYRKYRSWTDSVKDYELGGNIQGIIKLYDLEKYDREVKHE